MIPAIDPALLALWEDAERSALKMSRRHVLIGECALYLRIGPRKVESEMVRCLQIGAADVPEALQRQGHFLRALTEVRRLGLPIFIESVQNAEWGDALVARHGFRVLNSYMGGLIRDLFLPAKNG